jgi:GNAT superfamily N-acetyltransferase
MIRPRPARTSTVALLDTAIDAFTRTFAFTRSFTHPYNVERIGRVWVMRDGPRKREDYRNEEYVAYDAAPAEVDALARRHTRGRYAIVAIVPEGESDAEMRAAYKALGYRLNHTEPMMVHDLRRIPRFDAFVEIQRVRTPDLADRLNRAAGARQILPEHLTGDAPLRQYVALDAGRPVGWVRSIDTGTTTCCSNMYVLPSHRRRGIGRALLAKLLRDDRAAGASLAVLTATHTGAMLYPVVGYRQIGVLYVFTPVRRKA